MHPREALGQMRIEGAMLIPAPCRLRLRQSASHLEPLETAKEDTPHIAMLRRERAPVGQPAHAGPGKCQLHRPASIDDGTVVDRAIDMHGAAQAREIPIEKCPAGLARMRAPPEMRDVA